MARLARVAVRALTIAVLAAAVAGVVLLRRGYWSFTDLTEHRQAGHEMLYGLSLYGSRPGPAFTAPPFAAIVYVPLDLVSHFVAVISMAVVSTIGYLVFATVLARRAGADWWVTVIVVVGGVALEPVWHTVALGQINLVLAALIVLDCLVVGDAGQGWLIGLAAGISPPSAIFALYFLVGRHWAAAARVVGGLATTILASAVVAPDDAWRYWTKLVGDTDRLGGLAYVGNQSLDGDLIRLLREEHPPTAAYLTSAAVALVVALVAADRSLRAGEDVAAVTCIAMAGLLVAPAAWTHQWVWLLPAVLVLAVRRDWIWAGVVGGIGVVAPMWFAPATGLREFHHNPLEAAMSLTYTAAAACFLVRVLVPRPAGGAMVSPPPGR